MNDGTPQQRIHKEEVLWDKEYSRRYQDDSLLDISYKDYSKHFSSIPHYRPIYNLISDLNGKRVLDCGCGTGVSSVEFALSGADVTAIDVSEEAGRVLKIRAEFHNVGDKVKFYNAMMENMNFPDNTFDFVFGEGVLHHVEVDRALAEVYRVLKPGGRMGFVEPMGENPVINILRKLMVFLKNTEYGNDVPFRFKTLDGIKEDFPGVQYETFEILAALKLLIGKRGAGFEQVNLWKRRQVRFAQNLFPVDSFLIRHFPFMRRFARIVTITGAKPPSK